MDSSRRQPWNGDSLEIGPLHPLSYLRAFITNAFIVDRAPKRDSYDEAGICGAGMKDDPIVQSGRFYLEVLGYLNGYVSKWQLLGGTPKMIRVSYVAVNNSKK
jgi:hypothetical protein